MSVAPRLTDVRRLLSSRSFLATPSSFRTVPTPHFLMQPHRAFASWYSKMQDFVHKRKEVGEDLVGNKYYLQEDGAHEARRIVQYANDIPDPSSIEMLWYQWLRYGRDAPPTKEDLLEYRRQQEAFAKKVKKLEEEDAKLRLQEQLERKLRGEDYSTSKPDMSPLELLRQMEKQNSNPK